VMPIAIRGWSQNHPDPTKLTESTERDGRDGRGQSTDTRISSTPTATSTTPRRPAPRQKDFDA
jgi:hypothetical protein